MVENVRKELVIIDSADSKPSNKATDGCDACRASVFIKLAVDVDLLILAGGGEMHFDCEQMLLNEGSRQEHIWGAGFMSETQKITYDSLINIRSRQNRSMEILDPAIREQIDQIIYELLGSI